MYVRARADAYTPSGFQNIYVCMYVCMYV